VPGDTRLVAYVVTDADVAVENLRSSLSAQLAEYMVPSAFVSLAQLPLTPNGKIDRQALPAPDADAYSTAEYEAPYGESEEQLAAIWRDLLKVERVGRYDNFFALGGHSLLAVQLMSRVKQEFGVEISLDKLFASPTIAVLDECIVEAQLLQFDLSELEAIASGGHLSADKNTDTGSESNQ
jgi:acyl carrier protein